MSSLSNMRKSYDAGRLDKQDVAATPMVQFERWFEAAKAVEVPNWLELNAMTLATSSGGNCSSRVVLLKGRRESSSGPVWTFFSNYRSTKAKQINANPKVSLCFYWPHTQQQVRILGTASKSDRQTTVEYFHSRPRESQLGAVASEQSAVIDSRQTLQTTWDELRQQYENQEIPCPDHWGGYDVIGHEIEFWQGRPGRLHDRIRYRRSDDQTLVGDQTPESDQTTADSDRQNADHAWVCERLAP